MTAVVAVLLAALAVLDAAFSGFRSSLGRSGLIDHRREDRVGAVRGLTVGLVLLGPVAAAVAIDAAVEPERRSAYTSAGRSMLAIYLPYGVLVLLALIAYLTLGWRQRYLASALILGPFTLLRPAVAVAGAVFAVVEAEDAVVAVLACASVLAVLTVEPVVDRVCYGPDAARRSSI